MEIRSRGMASIEEEEDQERKAEMFATNCAGLIGTVFLFIPDNGQPCLGKITGIHLIEVPTVHVEVSIRYLEATTNGRSARQLEFIRAQMHPHVAVLLERRCEAVISGNERTVPGTIRTYNDLTIP